MNRQRSPWLLRHFRLAWLRMGRSVRRARLPWFLLALAIVTGGGAAFLFHLHDYWETNPFDEAERRAALEYEEKAEQERQAAMQAQGGVEYVKEEKLRKLLGRGGTASSSYPHDELHVRFRSMLVTEEQLDWLTDIPQLTELIIENPAWDGEGLARLKGMSKLRFLALCSPTTDGHLASLGNLPFLRQLSLWYSEGVTDAGLVHLKSLTNLEELTLQGVPITNEGLEHLSGLVHLTSLSLGKTKITDAGLVHLRTLEKLEYLDVKETKVTSQGAAELRKHLPRIKVVGASSPSE